MPTPGLFGSREIWLLRDELERRGSGIDRAVRLAVAVGAAQREAVIERLREDCRDVPRRALAAVLQHVSRRSTLPGSLLMRVTQPPVLPPVAHGVPIQRGRVSTPVNADCAAGRLALM